MATVKDLAAKTGTAEATFAKYLQKNGTPDPDKFAGVNKYGTITGTTRVEDIFGPPEDEAIMQFTTFSNRKEPNIPKRVSSFLELFRKKGHSDATIASWFLQLPVPEVEGKLSGAAGGKTLTEADIKHHPFATTDKNVEKAVLTALGFTFKAA